MSLPELANWESPKLTGNQRSITRDGGNSLGKDLTHDPRCIKTEPGSKVGSIKALRRSTAGKRGMGFHQGSLGRVKKGYRTGNGEQLIFPIAFLEWMREGESR